MARHKKRKHKGESPPWWLLENGDDDMTPSSSSYSGGFAKSCYHQATTPIVVGPYKEQVFLGALRDIDKATFEKVDIILPLNGYMPKADFGKLLPIMSCEMRDMAGVPVGWPGFIEQCAKLLEKGYTMLAYCTGSHGRTGTFAASLISILEGETPDPIEELRSRHCYNAVESMAQATAIYNLRGQELPEEYITEFTHVVSHSYTPSYKSGGSTKSTAAGTGYTDKSWEPKQGDLK